MTTVKEWIRDFKKKSKWDRFSIIFTIIIGVIGLFYGGYKIFVIYLGPVFVDKPIFNINNSYNFGVFYKSPNSVFTISPITETRILNENCDSSIYKNRLNFKIENFFKKIRSEGCGNFDLPDLKYNLFNVKIILPTNQELFIKKVLSNESYIIGYLNQDYSDACIVHKYKILNNFDKNQVCFNFIFGENPCAGNIDLKPGPAFFKDKSSCYQKISGEFDFLGNWTPNQS